MYAADNPARFIDKDGLFPVETIWDAANVGMGFQSLVSNIKAGKVGAAVVDGLGVVVDAAATVFPYIPGGVGTIIKSARAANHIIDGMNAAEAAVDAGKTIDNVSDVGKTIDNAGDVGKAIGPIGDPGGQVTKQLPESMQGNARTTPQRDGTVFTDPANPKGNNVRTMKGNPDSPNPAQQNPYVKETRNGKVIDKNGKPVPSDTPEAHIPTDEYKFNRYGK